MNRVEKEEISSNIADEKQFQVDLEIASFVLRSGGSIVYPTETVWGIGCDATSEDAVEQLIVLKRIQFEKPFIVLVDSVEMLQQYVDFFPEAAKNILTSAERPTTIIYPKAKNLAKNVLASDGSIGIRITNNAFCVEIMRKTKKPLVSTSANFSGKPTPAKFREIDIDIIFNADYVVRWSQEEDHESSPSSIMKLLSNGEVEKIR